MSKYTLRLAGEKVTSFKTDEPISKSLSRRLQGGTPDTRVDSGGNVGQHSFSEQKHERDTLREIKEIRETGGIVSQLVHSKALMQFGTGVELQTDNPDLKDWINKEFPHLDNLLIELGEDAIWFPYSLAEVVETRGGDFSHIEPVEPWTVIPIENEYGEVVAWEQEISGDYGTTSETYDPEELASIIINKSSGRDNTGISEVKRAEDAITTFMENRQAVNNAVEQSSYRRHWWQVGREGAGVIDDNELRRVRNRVDNLKEDTVLVTGRDVDHELMDAANPERFKAIREMDMRDMALALGVPIELASVISEGLGSGEQSGVRMQAFILEAKAAQRALGDQVTREILKPVVEEYSPYPADDLRGLSFGDPLNEEIPLKERAPYLTTNEVREELDKPPAEDDEIGESYRKPGDVEAPEGESGDGGLDDLFNESAVTGALEARDASDLRTLQEDFDASLFELVSTEDQEDFETGARLGIGVEFPNSGVYVDWNIDAWPEDDRLDGPHVSEYATVADAQSVAQGEVRELAAGDVGRGTGNRQLADSAPDFDEPYLRIFEERIWNEDATDRALVAFNESEVPEMVLERLKDAIRSGALFNSFDSIPSSELMELRETFASNLGSEGWSIRDLADDIEERFGVDASRAENIARSEVQATVNHAREAAYEERQQERGEEFKFSWVGPDDHRTTDLCEYIKAETEGGVTLDELKETIQDAPDAVGVDIEPRTFTPHPQCRHTYTRQVE